MFVILYRFRIVWQIYIYSPNYTYEHEKFVNKKNIYGEFLVIYTFLVEI